MSPWSSPLYFTLIYIDDIIIFSKSVEEHLAHLEEVFRRLREANVKLNPKKCSFVKQKVEYLCHVVTPMVLSQIQIGFVLFVIFLSPKTIRS